MRDWVPPILLVVAILAMCCVSYVIGYDKGGKSALQPVKVVTDTLVQVETLTVLQPVEKAVYKDRLVYVPVTDTLTVHDTTFVALQAERKVYEDEDYRAVVSGVFPKLEEISVYPKTITISTTRTVRQRWGFGVTAGPGVIYNGKIQGGVGIVAGLQYSF